MHPAPRLLAVAAVLTLLAAGAPPGATATDPCARTTGAAAVEDRVCWEGATVAVAPGPVSSVAAGAHGGVTFLTFEAADGGRFAVAREEADAWTPVLRAGQELKLRTPALAEPEAPYVLVQLATPMLPAWADALAARGVTVHAYVPENAFLVRAPDGEAVDALARLSFVTRVVGLAPQAKVEPGLLARNAAGEALLVHVLSVPGAPGAFAEVRAALDGLGAEVVFEVPEVERLTALVPAGALRDLAAVPHVWWIDRASLEAETDMDRIRVMTGASAVGVAVPRGFQGEGVVGMVMDVGFDPGHRDFQKSLLGLACPTARSSHGTSVYGIVFGSGEGDARALGMAPEAEGMMAYYRCGLSRYQTAVIAAQEGGVFHTNSWGEAVPKDNTYGSHSNENDRVVMDLDVLMLQSMSNCGPQCARREAMAKNILSVGALYHEDTEDLLDDAWSPQGASSRASTGPAADGRIKPELVGPYDDIFTTTLNHGYTAGFGGTSGATPVVAGAVALVNEMARADLFGNSPAGATPSPAAVKALLVATAEAYFPHQVMLPPVGDPLVDLWRRDVQGWGLPDLAALHRAAPTAQVADATLGLATGQVARSTYAVAPGAHALRVSLAWTDPPANPGASKTLVNDLDLELVSPDGTLYRGNAGLRSAPYSTEGGEPDDLNNLENVFVLLPEPGTWTVRIYAAAVNLDAAPVTPQVDQPFALVALTTQDLEDLPALPFGPTPPLPQPPGA